MEMIMSAKLFKTSIWGALPCAITCMLYMFLPLPIGGLLWCMFVGYCTTNMNGPTFKNLPHIWGSYALGILWALAFWYGYAWLATFLPLWAAMLLSIWIVTAALCIVNIGLLKNTVMDILPLYFPSVFTLFACGGDFSVYPWMIVSILIGSLTAMIGTVVWVKVESGNTKKLAQEQTQEV